ncbi:MAG: FAD-binding oxidoreductase [Roseiarcus sp.]|jgi:glycine/D-amino acid oxidase-like deaminating enzyme
MGPVVDPVESDQVLPAKAAVVVIGGGIIGTSAALALANRGVDVVLCEKGQIAGEQSSRNWGWVRKQGRDSREMPLIIESLRMWERLNEDVEAETGFRQAGTLYVCETDEELARRAKWLDIARPYQLDTRLLTREELAELMPGAARKFKGALYTKSDGRAEPQKAAPAVARAARRKGAKIFTNCAVRGIETSAGRVSGVVTEKGRIACDAVLLAGGAWSRIFSANAGLTLHSLRVRSSVFRTEPLEGGPEVAAWTPKVAYRRRLDGGYNIASARASVADIEPDNFRFMFHFLPSLLKDWRELHFSFGKRFFETWAQSRPRPLDRTSVYEEVRILDPTPKSALNSGAMKAMTEIYPVFASAKIAQEWAGIIDVTPDVVPVISGVDSLPGFFIACGFSGHGFGIGPAAGRLAADLVTGDRPIVDPHHFRFSRFTDGSNPRPEASV